MLRARADTDGGALLQALRERIRRGGPMPVDQYMQACLHDPAHGYWRRGGPIGAAGDFITAPEISQTFGELIGLWCAVAWESMGRPDPVRLVELGPGTGALMADALRAARVVAPFSAALRAHLIEVSAPLRHRQELALATSGHAPAWHASLDEVPPGAAIVLGNEFLDALPIRQLVFDEGIWRERVVDAAPESGLRFAPGVPAAYDPPIAPLPGAIAELRPGEDTLLAKLAARPGPLAALFIDYGPAEFAYGDTFQAVRRHGYADALASPGNADLTAHVQFGALAGKARAVGLAVDGPMPQAEFLGRLGLTERTAMLMAANPERADEIDAAAQRLASPTGMGGLFKVMAVRSPTLPRLVPFG